MEPMFNKNAVHRNETPSFYGNTNVISSERQSFLSFWECKGSSEKCIKTICEFGNRHDKYFIRFCFLALLIGVQVNDPLFAKLFGQFTEFVLFEFYSLLLFESKKDKVNSSYQARFNLYADHFANTLQNLALENAKTCSSISQIDASIKRVLNMEPSVFNSDRVVTVPCKVNADIDLKDGESYHPVVGNSCTNSSILSSSLPSSAVSLETNTPVRTKGAVFMPFDHLRTLKKGSRIDIFYEDGEWCNAEISDYLGDYVCIHLLFWPPRYDIKLTKQDTLAKKVAFPGTMADDHLESIRFLRMAENYPNFLPNIIECNAHLACVFDGKLRDSSNLTRSHFWKWDYYPKQLHAQVDVFASGKLLFHGCIEVMKFQHDFYYYAWGVNPISMARHFLPLCKSNDQIKLVGSFELRTPKDVVLVTENHHYC